MNNYKVRVTIKLKSVVLDPQGKTVLYALNNLGYDQVTDTRIGKLIELTLSGPDPATVRGQVAEMCDRLLSNPVIEDFEIEITEE